MEFLSTSKIPNPKMFHQINCLQRSMLSLQTFYISWKSFPRENTQIIPHYPYNRLNAIKWNKNTLYMGIK